MLEELIISLQDKFRSSDYIDNEQGLDKLQSLLQTQTSDKQKKLITSLLPLMLSNKSENIQKRAVQIVFNYPTILKEVLPTIVLAPDPIVKFWSYFMMMELGMLSTDEMIDIVNGKESDEIRKCALEILSRKPEKRIIVLLLDKICDPSWIISKQAKKTLIELGDSVYQIIQEYFQSCGSSQKYECIKLIPLILREKSFALYQKMLEADAHGIYKPYICAGLGEIRNDNALKVLLWLLDDESTIVKSEAIKALSLWGKDIVQPVISLFATASKDKRMSMMRLLGRVLGLEVVPLFNEIFGNPNQEGKYFLLTALSEIRQPEVIPILLQYLRDDSVFIRDYVRNILVNLGTISLDGLISQLDNEDEVFVIELIKVLGILRAKEAVRPLLFLIDNSRSTLIRTCAIEAISKLNRFELVANMLLLKLSDKDISIKHTIVENLSKQPQKAFLKDLIMSCLDKNQEISFWSREILKRREYYGASSLLDTYDKGSDSDKDRIIALVSKLNDDQLHNALQKDTVSIESLKPENVEIKVLRRKFSKENITDIRELLYYLHEEGGSDLHISIGLPPSIRLHGELIRTTFETLTPEKSRFLLYSIMNNAQKEEFQKTMELDFSYEISDCARFRVNVFMQKNGMAGVFRIIPNTVPSFDALDMDKSVMQAICNHKSGLVLVTGATGSGKSTTLAAMIDYINRTRYDHIITIEDPIEFVHQPLRSVVSQRELGTNTLSFSNALKSALREDPDVILVGEMRDLETMKLAIAASETGHLVFATLHTNSAYESVNRIIGTFPGDVQQMIRMQLAGTIRGIISQRLIPAYLGSGRVLAYEILVGSTGIKRCIKEDKTDQIISLMQTSRSDGMITMDQCLEELVVAKKITYEEGFKHAEDKKDFQKRLEGRLGKQAMKNLTAETK